GAAGGAGTGRGLQRAARQRPNGPHPRARHSRRGSLAPLAPASGGGGPGGGGASLTPLAPASGGGGPGGGGRRARPAGTPPPPAPPLRGRGVRGEGAEEPGRLIPHTPLRRTLAARMVAGVTQAAPVTLSVKIDATHLVDLRRRYREAGGEIPGYTDLLVKVAG